MAYFLILFGILGSPSLVLYARLNILRVLEKVDFETKFDKLPEFQPEKEQLTPIPQSPRVLLQGMRKKRMEDSPATPIRGQSDSR